MRSIGVDKFTVTGLSLSSRRPTDAFFYRRRVTYLAAGGSLPKKVRGLSFWKQGGVHFQKRLRGNNGQ